MTDYEPPMPEKDAFHCPHCGSYSTQHWTTLQVRKAPSMLSRKNNYDVSCCQRCEDITLWRDDGMVFPSKGIGPLPNSDMPEDRSRDYHEARDIASRSPRSACMLLRLCVEDICNEKVSGTGDLNEKIKKMVAQGLDDTIKNALDSVRVIGGQAVHPLEMDLRDDKDTALALFDIVNFISEWAYTRERKIKDIHNMLPQSKKDAISRRDATT